MQKKCVLLILVVMACMNCSCNDNNVISPPKWDLSGRIVFSPGGGSLSGVLMIDLNSPALTISPITGKGIEPRVNSDGTEIVYTGQQNGAIDIFRINISGGVAIDLTPDSTMTDSWPDWSPDGRSITFNRVLYPGFREAIYSMNRDGSNLRAVTDTASLSTAVMPRWSPDDSEIIYVGRIRYSPPSDYFLYSSAPDGSHQTILAEVGSTLSGSPPSWSPDSRRIAFGKTSSTIDDTTGGLYIVDRYSGITQHITIRDISITSIGASWLNDTKLMCVGSDTSGAYGIYVVVVPNVSSSKMIAQRFKTIPMPVLSPDGKHAAIFGTLTNDSTFALYIAGTDGTGFHKLKDIDASPSIFIGDAQYCQWIR